MSKNVNVNVGITKINWIKFRMRQTYLALFLWLTFGSFENTTLSPAKCSIRLRMMPNLGDFPGYQNQVPTSLPQKYWQSLAFEVLTDTCPQVSQFIPIVHQHILSPQSTQLEVGSYRCGVLLLMEFRKSKPWFSCIVSSCLTWVYPESFRRYLSELGGVT